MLHGIADAAVRGVLHHAPRQTRAYKRQDEHFHQKPPIVRSMCRSGVPFADRIVPRTRSNVHANHGRRPGVRRRLPRDPRCSTHIGMKCGLPILAASPCIAQLVLRVGAFNPPIASTPPRRFSGENGAKVGTVKRLRGKSALKTVSRRIELFRAPWTPKYAYKPFHCG